MGLAKRKLTGGIKTQITPWEYEWDGGVFGTSSGSVWMYMAFPAKNLIYETASIRANENRMWVEMLTEIAAGQRATRLARNRSCHLITTTWEEQIDCSGAPPNLRILLESEIYDRTSPHKAVFFGVELKKDVFWKGDSAVNRQKDSVWESVKKVIDKIADDDPASIYAWEGDIAAMKNIMLRYGGKEITPKEMVALKSWISNCYSPENILIDESKYLQVSVDGRERDKFWQFSTITNFRNTEIDTDSPWLAYAMGHESYPASMVSSRFELETSTLTRARAKRHRNKVAATIGDTEKVGESQRTEDWEVMGEIDVVEDYFAQSKEASVRNLSVIMAMEMHYDREKEIFEEDGKVTFREDLLDGFGIETTPLLRRQHEAFKETKPCAESKIGKIPQYRHHTTLSLLGASGIRSFSEFGDKVSSGVNIGISVPNRKEVRLDPKGASAKDKPPTMLVAGQPGSGKTMLSQHIAHQAVVGGSEVVFVNPKGADSLSNLLEEVPGDLITLGEGSEKGSLDPYRFAEPEVAAALSSSYISTILPDLPPGAILSIESCMRQQASMGAPKSTMQALASLEKEDKDLYAIIKRASEASAITELVLGGDGTAKPLGRNSNIGARADGNLTLIEFGSSLDLPSTDIALSEMPSAQRYGLGAVVLLMNAATLLMIASRKQAGGSGGILIIDEAWILFASPSAKNYLERLSRLGRSLDMLIIFATQRVSDLTEARLDEYISRSLILRLESDVEVTAALNLCGIDPANEDYRSILTTSEAIAIEDPVTGEITRFPPLGWLRDLSGEVGVIATHIPDHLVEFYSTNPEVKAAREREATEAALRA